MNEFEVTVRGKSPQTFRLTGRDGPPGSKMILGVPAWLAEKDQGYTTERQSRTCYTTVGNPLPDAGSKPEACRSRGYPRDRGNKHGIRKPMLK